MMWASLGQNAEHKAHKVQVFSPVDKKLKESRREGDDEDIASGRLGGGQ